MWVKKDLFLARSVLCKLEVRGVKRGGGGRGEEGRRKGEEGGRKGGRKGRRKGVKRGRKKKKGWTKWWECLLGWLSCFKKIEELSLIGQERWRRSGRLIEWNRKKIQKI